MFRLHERLAADTLQVEDWELCRVRLMNDSRFPWLILVPRRTDLMDIDQLAGPDKALLQTEMGWAYRVLREATHPFKLNVAALGNQVRQLHIHVIARFEDDAAWPAPVWGVGTPTPYSVREGEHFVRRLKLAIRAARSLA